MSKLEFKNYSINSEIIPAIDDVISELNAAININNGIYIPSDYPEKNFLNGYFERLKEIRKTFETQKNRINNFKTMIENSNTEFEESLLDIQNIEFELKKEVL